MIINKQLETNINNMKNIVGVTDVQVSQAPDYIIEQVGEDCVEFEIYGNEKYWKLYIPKSLCNNQIYTFDEVSTAQILAPLNDVVSIGTIKKYLDSQNEHFIILDGAINIATYNDAQQNLMELLASIDEIESVTIKKIIDPEYISLANCSNPILVSCHLVNTDSNRRFGFIVPEFVYSDESLHDVSLENLKQLINDAQK